MADQCDLTIWCYIRSNPATISLESSHNIKAVELVDRTFYELRNLLLSRHTEPAFFPPASWRGERCELSNTAFQFRKIPFRKRERNNFLCSRELNARLGPTEGIHFPKGPLGLGGRSRHRALPGVGARGVELNDSFKTAGWRHPKWLTIGRGFRIRFGAGLLSTTSSTPARIRRCHRRCFRRMSDTTSTKHSPIPSAIVFSTVRHSDSSFVQPAWMR